MMLEPSIVLLCVLALVAGTARGFSGFGAALIFVPLASRLVGPQQASPLLLMTDAIVALPLIWSAWSKASRRDVALLAAGGLVGAPLGTTVLALGDPLTLRWLIATLTALMLVLLLSGWRYRHAPSASATIGVGAVSGLFSGIAQIGGPPVVAYLLGRDTAAATMRATTILFFAVGSAISLVSYHVGGLLTGEVARLSLSILPFFAMGLWLGSRLFRFASEHTFRRICFGLIAGSLLLSLPVWG
jgi:uncharacterized protein